MAEPGVEQTIFQTLSSFFSPEMTLDRYGVDIIPAFCWLGHNDPRPPFLAYRVEH